MPRQSVKSAEEQLMICQYGSEIGRYCQDCRTSLTAALMSSIPCSMRSMWVRNDTTQMRRRKSPRMVVAVR